MKGIKKVTALKDVAGNIIRIGDTALITTGCGIVTDIDFFSKRVILDNKIDVWYGDIKILYTKDIKRFRLDGYSGNVDLFNDSLNIGDLVIFPDISLYYGIYLGNNDYYIEYHIGVLERKFSVKLNALNKYEQDKCKRLREEYRLTSDYRYGLRQIGLGDILMQNQIIHICLGNALIYRHYISYGDELINNDKYVYLKIPYERYKILSSMTLLSLYDIGTFIKTSEYKQKDGLNGLKITKNLSFDMYLGHINVEKGELYYSTFTNDIMKCYYNNNDMYKIIIGE